MTGVVRVAVGVLRDKQGRVLVALRPSHKHQGDLWEFPGGKIENGETPEEALARELFEELGVMVRDSVPLISVPFSYPDKTVLLEVREVSTYEGEPIGKEGQPIRWVAAKELDAYNFPEANTPIVTAVRLPERICITGSYVSIEDLRVCIERAISRGAEMVLFRPNRGESSLTELVPAVAELCRKQGVPLVLSAVVDRELWIYADGVHLRSQHLSEFDRRGFKGWLGASCHDLREAERAKELGADYLFLSPVRATGSHPGSKVLGWDGFAEIVTGICVPTYALGGLHMADLREARRLGARGIAGISAFWK